MGAWGHSLLENDTACDTLARLTDPHTEAPVASILQTIEEYSRAETFSEYLDDSDVNEILVCILLIIGFRDKKFIEERSDIGKYQEEKILTLIKGNQEVFNELIKKDDYYEKGEKLFERVLDAEKSETYELWQEACEDDFKAWLEMVNQIKKDLIQVTPKAN